MPDQEKDASKIDEHDRDTLTKRLEELVKEPRDSAPQARQPGDVTDEIEREIAILKASLGALTEAQNAAKSTGHEEVSTPDALGPFIAALDDSDESVRFEAMAALGDRLEPSLLPRIKALLDDRDPYIRRYAVEYYARLAGPEATQRLIKALDDSDESVRFEAMAALGDRLEPSLLPRIKALLDDRDPYIRRYAVEYYAQLSKKER